MEEGEENGREGGEENGRKRGGRGKRILRNDPFTLRKP